jgi:dihydropteroate synthase
MTYRHETVRLGPLTHRLGERALIMGIVNVTPDSFSDGGLFRQADIAIAHARQMVAEGADIVDVGGESTRPGHTRVEAEEEWARVEPVLAGLRDLAVPVSIDTYKASTAARATALGATIINDVWGLQRDPGMAEVVAGTGASAVLMHNRTEADASVDIIDDIRRFFDRSLDLAAKAGVPDDRIVLDPGIGFGKTSQQNLVVLQRLGDLLGHGLPLLMGLSRKSLLGRILDKGPEHRLFGTIAGNVIAVQAGAEIIRVHDIPPHLDAVRVIHAVRSAGR